MFFSGKLLKTFNLQVYDNGWDCRIFVVKQHTTYVIQFPFFKVVSAHINDLIHQSVIKCNEYKELEDNASYTTVGMFHYTL